MSLAEHTLVNNVSLFLSIHNFSDIYNILALLRNNLRHNYYKFLFIRLYPSGSDSDIVASVLVAAPRDVGWIPVAGNKK